MGSLAVTTAQPVTVALHSLQNQSNTPIPNSTLLSAFGPSSLGILVVSDLPPSFPALRSRVLTSISRLAHLPPSKLDALVNKEAKYLVGWSHGKESLRPGVVDTAKGSYYVNAAFNEDDSILRSMRNDYAGFEEYTAPNVWPDDLDIPGFQQDVEELVSMIVDVAGYVAQAVDRFAEHNVENYPSRTGATTHGYLESVVRGSRTSKARLLHYFPSEPSNTRPKLIDGGGEKDDVNDTWCATHLDHSCLTGLTSAAFFNESSSANKDTYTELSASPSPSAGLYILDRHSQIHKVSIPKDCLAFQTGEALERITKGKLKAVPHFVRGVDAGEVKEGERVARNTLAVFTQPNLGDVVDLDLGLTFGDFARGIVRKNTAG